MAKAETVGTFTEGRVYGTLHLIFEELKKLDPDMPLSLAHTFIAVALKEGQTVSELANFCGFSPSNASRNLGRLGEIDRNHNAGHGLVELVENPQNRSSKQARLTVKGKRVSASIMGIMGRTIR